MGKVLVDRVEKRKLEFLDSFARGKEGSCHFIEDGNKVLKLYYIYMKDRQVYFDDLKSLNISFPIDILIDSLSGLIVGYTMNYLEGIQIHSGFPRDVNLENLKKMYIDIKKEIEKFSNIRMNDLCVPNILADFNNSKFNLIDTSVWYPKDNAYNENMADFNKCLNYILCGRTLPWLNEYLGKSPELFRMYSLYKLGQPVSFIELLEAIELEVSKKFRKNVVTIDDLTPKVFKKNLIL